MGPGFAEMVRVVDDLRRAEARIAELEAMLAGRTAPPTDAEIRAHDGAWLVWWWGGTWELHASLRTPQLRVLGMAPLSTWWPLRDGRPCAWPVAP